MLVEREGEIKLLSNLLYEMYFWLVIVAAVVSTTHAMTVSTGCSNTPCRKILALHGGGQTAISFMEQMGDIINRAGDEYEFVFANGPYGNDAGRLWIEDPPGGKGQPTTDPGWDVESTNLLVSVVSENGPFYAILGYSQGTAAALSYLSHVDAGTFEVAITFCSYVPSTHEGIENRIRAAAPYTIPMFVYMGQLDFIIDNCQSNVYGSLFSNVTRATNPDGGHEPPAPGEPTFDMIFTFLEADHTDGSYTPPAIKSYEEVDADCPNFIEVILQLYWPWLVGLVFLIFGCFACCWRCCCTNKGQSRTGTGAEQEMVTD